MFLQSSSVNLKQKISEEHLVEPTILKVNEKKYYVLTD